MQLRQHWRITVALLPAMLIGTFVFDHLRKLGWDQLGARAAQFSVAFVLGMTILWALAKFWPTNPTID